MEEANEWRLAEQRWRQLIGCLIIEAPDRLAFHVYRRLAADRVRRQGGKPPDTLT